ncbi:MAG: hypothetical protein QG656_2743 [Candidatus Hydrogenedentes bacterium]|nr:hypothetical protein [Candidatus Hydrogenedentota bacterium]
MLTQKNILHLGLILLVVCCAGCPPVLPGAFRFTSADLNNQGNYRNDMDMLAPVAGEGAEGEGTADTREVVEPDVIRLSGNLLYVLNQYRGLTLVDLDTQAIVSQVPTYGYPRDLYVVGDRAYVLVGYSNSYSTDGDKVSFEVQARLFVVNVATPAQAAITGEFELEGDLIDSRLVGNVLYAVCANYEWYWEEGGVVSGGVAVPDSAAPGVGRKVMKAQTSDSWVTSVNVADPANIFKAAELSFAGYGNLIQASNQAIFVASSDWWTDSTTITYIDIANPDGAMAVRGNIAVKGYVADRFKMDAYNGVLRVVSSGGNWNDRRVYITTVDLANPDQLAQLGQYELADAFNESLFATRFDGPRAYIVTYFMVDPLFVVDLSDPAKPVVAGALTVPGWSTYIQPMGDRLLALGVDDTAGRRVCVSLFDVSDPSQLSNPEFNGLIDRVTFGEDWSWSSAYDDVKAFTVLDDLVIVPFSGWNYDYYGNGGYDRLQFISYTRDDLTAHGAVDLEGSILRSLEYNGTYFGVTTEQLAVIDGTNLDAPAVTKTLTLAEYVQDFVELSPSLAAEIVVRYDTGKTTVRTVGLTKAGLGEAVVPMSNVTETFAYGNSVVLVGAEWGYWNETGQVDTAHYNVAMVNCADPAAPVVAGPVRVDVQPYYGYYWYGYGGIEPMMDKNAKSMVAPYYMPWTTDDTAFLVGDTLALRCYAETYDTTLGANEPGQGLALLRLNDGTLPVTTVGLGFEQIVSLDQAGASLYLGTCETAQGGFMPFWQRQALCAYYIQEINVAEPSIGPAANVPGMFVQYDPASDVLTLEDYQWQGNGNTRSYLRTVSWDGSESVTTLSDLQLPDNASRVLGAGGSVYYDENDNGYALTRVSIGRGGELGKEDTVLVTDQWGSLLGARGLTAYVVVGNAIARYDFGNEGHLADLYQVMGYPSDIRFGTNHAFVPLGYFGVATLPL